MRPLFAFLFTLALAVGGQAAQTALSALKALPKGEAKRLARIEAFEGKPVPDRWHLLVHDPESENGLHEYVVAAGEVVASREISQFAEELKPEDVIGGAAVKIDSDKVAQLANRYALANDTTVATFNYELVRNGPEAAPVWRVTCLNEAGAPLATLVVTASKGTVVSHEGFAVAPPPEVKKSKPRADVATRRATLDRAAPIAERRRVTDSAFDPFYEEERSASRGRRDGSRRGRRESADAEFPPLQPPPAPVRRVFRLFPF